MPAHTPGPLEVLDNYMASFHNESPARTEEVWEVASREHGETIGYATTEANARLIAAAPEMLDLLTDLLDQVTGPAGVWGDGAKEFNDRKAERIERARALLARLGAL